MTIITGFRSTTVWRAFILNALATSVAICVAILLHIYFYADKYRHVKMNRMIENVVLMFLITFLATFTSYVILNAVFGFGGGMLVNN